MLIEFNGLGIGCGDISIYRNAIKGIGGTRLPKSVHDPLNEFTG